MKTIKVWVLPYVDSTPFCEEYYWAELVVEERKRKHAKKKVKKVFGPRSVVFRWKDLKREERWVIPF